MQDSNTYRHYANDCRRIAETMSAKDKAIMLEMAKVWDERAEEAERAKSSEPSSEQGRPRLEVGQPSVRPSIIVKIVRICYCGTFVNKSNLT